MRTVSEGTVTFPQSRKSDRPLPQHRKTLSLAAGVVSAGDGPGEGAHAQDVALALGDADRLARVEQVEDVRGLQRLLVRRQRQRHLEQRLAVLLALVELGEQRRRVRVLEIERGLLHLVLVIDVAVSHAALRAVGPDEVVDALDALQVHREALETVGDLAHHGLAVEPARLLEVRELRDLHAVQPDFPAESPGAERRRFPVVLDEAQVVHQRVDAECHQRAEVAFDEVVRRRLHHDLELVVVLEPERVVAVSAVCRPPARLHIRGVPGFRAERAQERRGVESAGADFHVVGLQQHAALLRPVALDTRIRS